MQRDLGCRGLVSWAGFGTKFGDFAILFHFDCASEVQVSERDLLSTFDFGAGSLTTLTTTFDCSRVAHRCSRSSFQSFLATKQKSGVSHHYVSLFEAGHMLFDADSWPSKCAAASDLR